MYFNELKLYSTLIIEPESLVNSALVMLILNMKTQTFLAARSKCILKNHMTGQ